MLTKEQAKEKLKNIIEKYERLSNSNQLVHFNEERTKIELIDPLFEVLGWDMRNTETDNEVTREEKVSKGWVDYGFKINGVTKFYLEAKSFKEDLNKFEFAEQAINYSWHKGVTWAVLTNFTGIRIFNAEVKGENIFQNQLFPELKYFEFIEKFDKLWLLSKESFIEEKINSFAEEWGKKRKRERIDKHLLDDFTKWREKLSKDIYKNNKGKLLVSEEDVDESIQRILDRLIFIRKCEDKGLEDRQLMETLRAWRDKPEGKLIDKIRQVFSYFDEIYNSKLFAKHLCDQLYIDSDIIKEIIYNMYYSKDKTIYYNFDLIDADILGNVYEQYLSHILKKTEKSATLTSSLAHKKEQGIYYTPTYIVDYIVKNTLGEILKEKNISADKIKLLDPACGSGSFLIKAFDVFCDYPKDFSDMPFSKKTSILQNNLFGVDLDKQAVEITQLNLLLKVAERGYKLPLLQNNVQNGNSLIDDPKIAGDKAFDWEGEFKEIMQNGGFDVVIGNPPYVFTRDVEFQDSFKEYIKNHYFSGEDSISKSHARQSGKVNLYAVFLIKSIQLLKEGGLFSFIIPNNILRTTTYDVIRKFILDNCKIIQIVDMGSGVFENVTASTIILVLQKEKDKSKRDKNKACILEYPNLENAKLIEQKSFLKNTSYAFNITLDKLGRQIFESIERDTEPLGELVIIHAGGIATGQNKNSMIEDYKKNEKYKPMLEGKDIKPYYPTFSNRYILYDRKLLYRAREENIFLSKEKLITQRIGGGNNVLVVSYDNEQYYTFNSTNTILFKNKISLKYILVLLNSKLINWYYVNKFTNKSTLTVNISKTFLEQIPIKKIDKTLESKIIELVNKMITTKKKIVMLEGKETDEKHHLEEEVTKLSCIN